MQVEVHGFSLFGLKWHMHDNKYEASEQKVSKRRFRRRRSG